VEGGGVKPGAARFNSEEKLGYLKQDWCQHVIGADSHGDVWAERFVAPRPCSGVRRVVCPRRSRE